MDATGEISAGIPGFGFEPQGSGPIAGAIRDFRKADSQGERWQPVVGFFFAGSPLVAADLCAAHHAHLESAYLTAMDETRRAMTALERARAAWVSMGLARRELVALDASLRRLREDPMFVWLAPADESADRTQGQPQMIARNEILAALVVAPTGLSPLELTEALTTSRLRAVTVADVERAHELGITGVHVDGGVELSAFQLDALRKRVAGKKNTEIADVMTHRYRWPMTPNHVGQQVRNIIAADENRPLLEQLLRPALVGTST